MSAENARLEKKCSRLKASNIDLLEKLLASQRRTANALVERRSEEQRVEWWGFFALYSCSIFFWSKTSIHFAPLSSPGHPFFLFPTPPLSHYFWLFTLSDPISPRPLTLPHRWVSNIENTPHIWHVVSNRVLCASSDRNYSKTEKINSWCSKTFRLLNQSAHTHTRTHARTHTHTRTHARTHTRTHARTHARTHTHGPGTSQWTSIDRIFVSVFL